MSKQNKTGLIFLLVKKCKILRLKALFQSFNVVAKINKGKPICICGYKIKKVCLIIHWFGVLNANATWLSDNNSNNNICRTHITVHLNTVVFKIMVNVSCRFISGPERFWSIRFKTHVDKLMIHHKNFEFIKSFIIVSICILCNSFHLKGRMRVHYDHSTWLLCGNDQGTVYIIWLLILCFILWFAHDSGHMMLILPHHIHVTWYSQMISLLAIII